MAEFSENSVNFDSLDEELESLGHYNNGNASVEIANGNNLPTDLNTSNSEPKEPPDKTALGALLAYESSNENSLDGENEDHNFLLFNEDAQNKKDDSQNASESVASLTSAFEGSFQTQMEKYTEEALKTFQTKNKLQLKLEEELNALSQEAPQTEKQESKTDMVVNAVVDVDAKPKIAISDITNFSQEDDEFISFTLPKEEEEMEMDVKPVIDATKIVEDILDELIPCPFNIFRAVDDIVDELIVKATLNDGMSVSPNPQIGAIHPVPVSLPPPPPFVPLPSKKVRGKIYPPTFPPMDRPGRMTNRLEYIRKKVLPAMFNHKDSWPFKTPVDAVKLNIPDYHTIVRNPMDLGTIKKRLMNRYYWNAQECQDDFKLMFGNCYLYNKPVFDIYAMCKELEKAYDKKIELMKMFNDLDVELERGFTVLKRKKKLPGEAPVRKRHCSTFYKPKPVKFRTILDFEDEIRPMQVHMPYSLAKKLKKPQVPVPVPPAEESSSEESDEEYETESDEDEGMASLPRAPGRAFPSQLKTYVSSQPRPQPATPPVTVPTSTSKQSEKKQKHLCKFCEQPFLSRTVRDLHEKAKHMGVPPATAGVSSPQPVIKKVPPLKLKVPLKKSNNALQIVPLKQENDQPPIRNGPQSGPPVYNNQTDTKTQFQPRPGPAVSSIPSPANLTKLPNQPFIESDIMNFVDKKHKAMSKQRQQKNNQSYYRYLDDLFSH